MVGAFLKAIKGVFWNVVDRIGSSVTQCFIILMRVNWDKPIGRFDIFFLRARKRYLGA